MNLFGGFFRRGESQPRLPQRGHPLLDEQVQAGIRGDFAKGWEIAETLAKLTPDCNRAKFNRAWYELMNGQLHKGLCLLDAGRWEQVFGDRPLPTTKPIYRDEDLNNKHLLLCSEGGLGDEIINARFAADFAKRGAKVIITSDPGLSSIFSRIEGVAAACHHKAAPQIHHDFWVPSMSAARVLQYEYGDLQGNPYLSVHSDFQNKWSNFFSQLHPRPRIGLRFFGNPKFEHEQHRRFPESSLVEAVGDRPWISLQKETSNLKMETWEDTLAIIDQLDLVITSCTSVAHASAALGKPTWILIPVLPYYTWALPGNSTPWYKSVRLFRQKTYGDWTPVFAEIRSALKEWDKGN